MPPPIYVKSRRGLALAFLAIALGLSTVAASSESGRAAPLQSSLTLTAPSGAENVLPEGADYFTHVLGDPREMTEQMDIYWLDGVSHARVEDGTWRAELAIGARLFPIFPGLAPGAANLGQTGLRDPIDADRFRVLSYRLYVDHPVDYVWWGLPGLYSDGGSVVAEGRAAPGWLTYVHHLDEDWYGHTQGLMVDFRDSVTDFRLDWLRLSEAQPPELLEVIWEGTGSGTVDFFLDTDKNHANGILAPVAAGISDDGRADLPVSVAPPGRYFVNARHSSDPSGEGAYAPGSITIEPAPILSFSAPSMQSGADYASVELGNPWDMDSSDDIFTAGEWSWVWGGLTEFPEFREGVLHARTQGQNPFLLLAVDPLRPIDTSRYRYLSWRWKVEDNLAGLARLGDENGWVTRFHYFSDWPITEATRNTVNDIIIWDGWQTYEIDLSEGFLDDVLPGQGAGWSGEKTVLEFDPLEGWRSFGFAVDWVRLTAEPEASIGDTYDVAWSLRPSRRPITVKLRYDNDRVASNGFAGPIAELAPPPPATPPPGPSVAEHVAWLPSASTRKAPYAPLGAQWQIEADAGRYYIAAEVSDGLQTTFWHSRVPVVVRMSSP